MGRIDTNLLIAKRGDFLSFIYHYERHVVSNHRLSPTAWLTAYVDPQQRKIIVRIAGPLRGEFTGDWWIRHTKYQ